MNTQPIESILSLRDKVVVITGGSGVLLGAIAQAAIQVGAKVALLDIAYNATSGSVEKKKKSSDVIHIYTDVCDRESLRQACDIIVSEFGKIDCLVNGAGGNIQEATTSSESSFFDLTEDGWRKVLNLNFIGAVNTCQILGKEIAKQGVGSIVNIASISGLKPLTRAAGYAAGKAAVINFTQWLAVYMCHSYSPRIRVNAICPGFFATQQNHYLLYDEDGCLTLRGKTILKHVPQNRFGVPEELSGAVLWLLSDASTFVTGSMITVDGGFTAFSGV